MPSRNSRKQYIPNSYYHIYNRGVARAPFFVDDDDFIVFLSLLKRYLSKEPQADKYGRQHPNYYGKVELLAFCLMPNHFHMLIYQNDEDKMLSKFIQSLTTAYAMYFNRKYKRVGPIFQGRFRASHISREEYLQHISRYIHLNPNNYKDYEWSSLPYYSAKLRAEWIQPAKIIELFDSQDNYRIFLEDYESHKAMMDEIKYELANSI